MTALQVAAPHLRRDVCAISAACHKVSSVWEEGVSSRAWNPKDDFVAVVVVLCREHLLREGDTPALEGDQYLHYTWLQGILVDPSDKKKKKKNCADRELQSLPCFSLFIRNITGSRRCQFIRETPF